MKSEISYDSSEIGVRGVRLVAKNNDQEIARAVIYFLKNELHSQPFGFIEDVYVDEVFRGRGIGSALVKELVNIAKANECYKIIMTSRYANEKVHKLYNKLGFMNWGKEFRMDI